MNKEHIQDRILHHIIVERPIDLFDLINQYVDIIYEQRYEKEFKDILEEYLTIFAEEINEFASDQTNTRNHATDG